MKIINTLQISSMFAFVALAACHPTTPTSPPPISGQFSTLTLDASSPQDNPALARTTNANGITRVYTNAFETAPGPEWSQNSINKTAKGNRPYLGDFSSRLPVTLALADLPKHDLVRISFDLFLFNGWNGSSPYWGFARWDLNLGDGRNLIHTTFSNVVGNKLDITTPQDEQAFPDTYPIRIHPAFTGSTEKASLGAAADDQSSVYHMVLTFPHSDQDITFGFQSVVQEGKNRSWGLANLTVETMPAPPAYSEAQIAQLWKTLGEADATKAFAAQWELASIGNQAVDYIAKHLDEDNSLSYENIVSLVNDLESADDEHLDEFLAGISHEGNSAIYPLRQALEKSDLNPDYKARLDRLIYVTKRQNANATQLRLFRAQHLLDVIHTKSSLTLKLTIPDPSPRNVDSPNPVPAR